MREIAPNISQEWEEKYVKNIMGQNAGELSENLLMFKDHFLKNIITSEAAVERVFIRHKAMHSHFRAKLLPEMVDDILFVTYNIHLIFPEIFALY